MSLIQTHSFTITQALQSCFYRIPDYQREYVWGPTEAVQLLDDITESIDAGGKQYFVGTVLVAADGPGRQADELDVIDGQQRTTTFFLMLCALRRRFRGHPQQPTIEGLLASSYTNLEGMTVSRLRLEPCYENAADLVQFLRQYDGADGELSDALDHAAIERFGSAARLTDVFLAISEYLDHNFPEHADLARFWGHLANNVIFIQIQTDVSSALKIFETINERGIGLNPMDLLKNLLFAQVKQDDFAKLKDKWKKITTPLEQKKQKPLRFLRYFVMANYKIRDAHSKGIVREDQIYSWFVDKDNAAVAGYATRPFEFVDTVAANVERYLAFQSGRDSQGSPSAALANLQHLTGTSLSQHHVLLLAGGKLRPANFEHLVEQIENFLFFYVFTRTSTKDLEALFSRWADEIREFSTITDEATQRLALNEFIATHFQSSIASKHDELRDALRRYRLGSMPKYRSRYLLARITQHVDMAHSGTKTRGLLSQYTNLEIEHILPQTPRSDLLGEWCEGNDEDYQSYVNRLGNLTLLEKPHNIVAGNDFYDSKKPLYSQSGNYLTRSIAQLSTVGKNTTVTTINSRLQAFEHWDAKAIDVRTEVLISLALEIWSTAPAA
ncbi:DUF262 domain-containing protein [Rhodococcus spelaei]|uniref:DUF262 domain-containing protein n=1 Tax=Rhodococcus spelaei TaxID=2546320 RepID=A0A541B0D8_9NOCA|nr:DUF262 domain-containing protein [Rhodococcus spelaei]TQF65789.1 DUF262 domain-containing protein [Rhodococcus spelaei]